MPRPTLAALLLALAAAGPAAADPAPLEIARITAQLYAAAAAAGDPVMLATAAHLRKEAGLSPDLPLSADAMLDAAAALAGDDPALIALIDDIRAETAKGVASGPIYHLAALPAGEGEARPPMPFRGGEYAEVYVEAAPGQDINLTVMDAAGNVVCSDTDPSHVAYCGWTPAADGDFVMIIENAGSTPADYALLTN